MINANRLINLLERERKSTGFNVIAEQDQTVLFGTEFAAAYRGALPRELLGYLASCTGTIPQEEAVNITMDEYGQMLLMDEAKRQYAERFGTVEQGRRMGAIPVMLHGFPLYQSDVPGDRTIAAACSRFLSVLESGVKGWCQFLPEHGVLLFCGDGWEWRIIAESDLNHLTELEKIHWMEPRS